MCSQPATAFPVATCVHDLERRPNGAPREDFSEISPIEFTRTLILSLVTSADTDIQQQPAKEHSSGPDCQ